MSIKDEIKRICGLLNCTEEEAKQLIREDREIESGDEITYGLTKKEENDILKDLNIQRNETERKRKTDDNKVLLFDLVFNSIKENTDFEVQTEKNQRCMHVKTPKGDYTISFVKHRTPKTAK